MSIHIPSQRRSDHDCCPDVLGCCNRCPDHVIRRHDTKPPFRVSVEDNDGPMELEGLVLEVNMWARARLKRPILSTDTYFQLADNIGFDQAMVGDLLIFDRIRQPEHMLVTGFDEDNYFIQVQRGYNGTTPGNWKKGARMRIFRVMNSPAITESRYEDQEFADGTINKNQLTESFLVYEWKPEDTRLPGCYWLEFKLLKMKARQFFLPGGKWLGTVHTDNTGSFFTGEFFTDSSVGISAGLGTPSRLVSKIRSAFPDPLYADPNFVEPIIPQPEESNYDIWRYIVQLYPNPEDLQLRWLIWDKVVHLNLETEFYLIPENVHWTGAVHLWSDGNWYTGTNHDDGSVYLDVNGLVLPRDASYNENGLVSVLCDSYVSIIPSFGAISGISNVSEISTDFGMTQIESDFGYGLSAEIEWIRRFPSGNEDGFIVHISNSPTNDLF